jgi:hypothetical protein
MNTCTNPLEQANKIRSVFMDAAEIEMVDNSSQFAKDCTLEVVNRMIIGFQAFNENQKYDDRITFWNEVKQVVLEL